MGHTVLTAFLLLFGAISVPWFIFQPKGTWLYFSVSSFFIGILGHEHLDPEHDHSSH